MATLTGAIELKATSAVVLNQRAETEVADWVALGTRVIRTGSVDTLLEITKQDVLHMELFLFFAGMTFSWLIAHIYYRQSSKNAPEWAQPLIESLPETEPSQEELLELVKNYVVNNSLLESGSNADGEWFRYSNGEQICKGRFTANHEAELKIPFPAAFTTEPSLDLSGEIQRVKSKYATPSEFVVDLHPESLGSSDANFAYQARGHWNDPHSA